MVDRKSWLWGWIGVDGIRSLPGISGKFAFIWVWTIVAFGSVDDTAFSAEGGKEYQDAVSVVFSHCISVAAAVQCWIVKEKDVKRGYEEGLCKSKGFSLCGRIFYGGGGNGVACGMCSGFADCVSVVFPIQPMPDGAGRGRVGIAGSGDADRG